MYVDYFYISNTELSQSVIWKNSYLLILFIKKKDYIVKEYIYNIGLLMVNIEFIWRGWEMGRMVSFNKSFPPFCTMWNKCYISQVRIVARSLNVRHNLESILCHLKVKIGPSWWWLYCSWIYNYLCYQCLSPCKHFNTY
jgi:hypothetical protein